MSDKEPKIKTMTTLSGHKVDFAFTPESKTAYEQAVEQNRAETNKFLKKLDEIAEKNNCLRVRLLDGLANWIERKSASFVAAIRGYAMKISQPCVIKLPPKNDEKMNEGVKWGFTSLGIKTKEK